MLLGPPLLLAPTHPCTPSPSCRPAAAQLPPSCRCPAAALPADKGTIVKDAQGYPWGFDNDASCAYRSAEGQPLYVFVEAPAVQSG